MLDNDSIAAFLYFGYLPEYPPPRPDWLQNWFPGENRRGPVMQSHPGKLIAEGIEVFRAAVQETIEAADTDKTQVLPLSGGMDSRSILGALLQDVGPSSAVSSNRVS